MRSRRELPIELVVMVVVGFIIGAAIWKFSAVVGLDLAAGGRLLFGLVLAFVLLGYGWWQENCGTIGFFTVQGMIPAALAVAWLGLWPALQQWGAIGPMFAGMSEDARPVEWWAAGWFRWLVLTIVLVPGYWIVYRKSN